MRIIRFHPKMKVLPPPSNMGLIAAGIAVAIIAVVNTLGTQLNATFTSISTQAH